MIIHILAGGPASLVPDLQASRTDDILWVGVDSGVFTLLESDIQPSYAFGDFDSITLEQKHWLEQYQSNVKVFPRAKDKTDLELALQWAIDQQPEKIKIFGATGGRLDHELANISLLMNGIQSAVSIQMIDRNNIIEARAPGTYQISRLEDFQYVSFLPYFSDIKGLTLNGFKYPLDEYDVCYASTRTVSNELNEEKGTYSFLDGIVLVVRSRDGFGQEK